MVRCLTAAGIALAAMLAALSDLRAQDYPSRPVKIIVPFPAGGTADVMPRVFGEWLSKKWGQPVVIENRTGAAGNIGAEAVAKAEPDGYTLLSAPPPPLVINQNLYPKMGFDPTEFVPIVIMGRVPNALVVNPSPPATSRLIAYAKSNPASSPPPPRGNGTTSHLTSELFQLMADVKFQHVPYQLRPALTDLVAAASILVRQSRRIAGAGEGRAAQAAGGGDGETHGVAAGRADDCGNAARVRIGGVVRHRRAAEDAEGDRRQDQRRRQ